MVGQLLRRGGGHRGDRPAHGRATDRRLRRARPAAPRGREERPAVRIRPHRSRFTVVEVSERMGATVTVEQSVPVLVQRAVDGDEAAWAAIVDRYATLIWAVCRRFGLYQA